MSKTSGNDPPKELSGQLYSAASDARRIEIEPATPSFRTIEIGEQRLLVADEAMSRVCDLLERIATVDLPVVILGETGTGKELAANALHYFSGREGPLVAFNCAALQETLAENELFGHERGAFSGAQSDKPGLLETADGGTLFFGEVAELSSGIQAKLLRVLETRRFTRVGGVAERAVDVRLVAATNRDLLAEVERGRFRRDLYFRLSAATVWLPPLRDRRAEIPILARAFLDAAPHYDARGAAAISEEAMQRLVDYAWPGNVRELKNCVEFLAASVSGDLISAAHVESYLLRATGADSPPAEMAPSSPPSFRPIKQEIQELERTRMIEALRAAHGNQTLAAALIEMPLRTFVAKIKTYGIDPKAIRQ